MADVIALCKRKVYGSPPLLSVRPTVHDGLEGTSMDRLGNHDFEEFGSAFKNPGNYISKNVNMIWPAVADELGDVQIGLPSYLSYLSMEFPHNASVIVSGTCLKLIMLPWS